jgi:hypothetical protein
MPNGLGNHSASGACSPPTSHLHPRGHRLEPVREVPPFEGAQARPLRLPDEHSTIVLQNIPRFWETIVSCTFLPALNKQQTSSPRSPPAIPIARRPSENRPHPIAGPAPYLRHGDPLDVHHLTRSSPLPTNKIARIAVSMTHSDFPLPEARSRPSCTTSRSAPANEVPCGPGDNLRSKLGTAPFRATRVARTARARLTPRHMRLSRPARGLGHPSPLAA